MTNIKKLILLIVIGFLNYTSIGQANTGIIIGGNLSYLTGDLTYTNELDFIKPQKILKPGIYTGIFWDIKTGYNSYLQIGGIYSQQGTFYKAQLFRSYIDSMQIEKYTYTINSKIDYFKVPILWKQTWGDWYTKLGFWGAYALLKESLWKGYHDFSGSALTDTGSYGSFAVYGRDFDFGVNFSLGFQIPVSQKNDFFVSINYSHGLVAFNPSVIKEEEKMYNRYFTLSTGIIFGKGSNYNRSRR
ncbi:MAG: hypothetical protein JXR68_13760 [Bacteroidales bacterium]|nr:hypothetical protein [Bacteroidales bacterium]